MAGCDVVYYCVVDARPWLRDPTPMWRTNVEGLRGVLDVAAEADLRKFVFTSSVVTIGIPKAGLATEEIRNNWVRKGGEYAKTRVAAEDMVMDYCHTRGLPAVAMCVANTYGSGDYLPHRTAAWSRLRCAARCRSTSRASGPRSSASPMPPQRWCSPVSGDASASATSSPSGSCRPKRSSTSRARRWVSSRRRTRCRVPS